MTLSPEDLSLVEPLFRGASCRVMPIPLDITLRRHRLVSKHAIEGGAPEDAVRAATGLAERLLDVLPPAACEV